MLKIEEYILLSLQERQAHLKLDAACLERGGLPITVSIMMRGVLAFVFNTSVPSGQRIQACHACNNDKCSNINHVYWGTVKENRADSKRRGNISPWQYTIAKYGLEKAKAIQKEKADLYYAAKRNRGREDDCTRLLSET